MTIDNLEIQISSSSQQASNGILKLSSSLTTLKQVAKGGAGLGSVANSLKKLNEALATMQNPSEKLKGLVTSLNTLSSIDKATGLKSTITQLKKLPEVAEALDKADMGKFAKTIEQVTKAIKPLANEMEKVSAGFSALPTKIQRVIQSNERLTSSNRKNSSSYGILGTGIKSWQARLGIATAVANRLGGEIGNWIDKSNAYVENLNLFTVSLGEYADEAKEYAETVGELMGIDPSDWLRAQGIFNTLATGFGIASDKASIMSKNLTQLSYDISSLYNIKVEDAMTKLQSAFSGELEPVRRLGYDLSQTKLQAIASANGIDILVSDMTQAEKSMLRYYALMTQVTVAQGDMARTLNAPANQLRIFNSQLTQLQRSLGNIFIPLLNKILPYLIAMVQVLRDVANEIAKLFGFELPEIDYSSLNNLGSETSENLDDATKSAKKLKNYVMGFDELNILNKDDGSGAGDDLSGLRFDLNIPQYDFLGELTESETSKIAEKLKEPFKEILDIATKIGLVILGWKIGTGISGFVSELNDIKGDKLKNLKMMAGITLMVTGFSLEFSGAKAIGRGDADLMDYIKTALGAALGIAGSLLVFGTNPLGWTIGIITAVAVLISGITVGLDEKLDEVVKDAFYEYEVGDVTITDLSDHFSELFDNITETNQPLIDSAENIKELKEKATTTGDEIQKIATALYNGYESANVNVPLLIEKFNELSTQTKTIMDEVYDNIIFSITGSLSQALIDSGADVEAIIDEINKIKGETTASYEEIRKKMNELTTEYDNGKISMEYYSEEVTTLKDQMLALMGEVDPLTEAFLGVEQKITGIDWEDPNAKNNAFEVIKNSATTAMESIDEAYKTHLLQIEQMKNLGLSQNYVDELIASATTVREEQIAKAQEYGTRFANIVQTELIKGIEKEYEAGKASYADLNFFERAFEGNETEWVYRAVNTYKKDYINPITTELETLLGEVGLKGEGWAKTASENIINSIFNIEQFGLGSEGRTIYKYGENIEVAIKKELDKIDVQEEAKNVGKSINTGIESGINENSMLVRTATEDLSSLMISTTMEKLGIHSPSTVFADFGLNIDQGLANGITDNNNLIYTSMDDMLNTLLGKFEEFTNRIRTALNSMLSDFARSMASMSVDEDGEVSYSKIQPKSIPRFATGGFPENGLFFANSSEIVGKFSNGRTAVANNQQITDGIATAVYNAVVSANQQQGSRDVNVYLDGKQVNTSVEKAKREKGTSIMTGGLIYG